MGVGVNDHEILGLDEILGSEMSGMYGVDAMYAGAYGRDPIFGAAEALAALGQNAVVTDPAQRVALARAMGGVAVGHKGGKGSYEQILPFPGTNVLAGALFSYPLTPQRLFRPERFVISSSVATFFDITNITIGQDPQFVQTGRAPGDVFSEVGVGVRLKGTTANLGNTIVVEGQNIDVADHLFRASIIGIAVY
jgi:hypothetical protein